MFTTSCSTKTALFVVFGLLFAAAVAVNFVVAYRTRPAYQAMIPGQQELDRYRMAIDPYRRFVVLAIVRAARADRRVRRGRRVADLPAVAQRRRRSGSRTRSSAWTSRSSPSTCRGGGSSWASPSRRSSSCLIAAAVTHYLYGGLRLQATLGERATPAARVHLSVLLGTFVLLKAVAYWLDRYGLAVNEDQIGRADFTGLDLHRRQRRAAGKTDPGGHLADLRGRCSSPTSSGAPGCCPGSASACCCCPRCSIGGVYPAIVQRFQVRPNEPDHERPYIERNIDATRDGVRHRRRRGPATTPPRPTATPGQLRDDADTTAEHPAARPGVLSPTFQNLQQIRAYYDFPDDAGRRPLHRSTARAATS